MTTSFMLMTPRGIPESGWIICSAFEENGATVVQVQTMARSADPLYEIGFRVMGARAQERIWAHALTSLASFVGVAGQVQTRVTCIDPRCQWSEVKNVWHNAMLRSFAYTLTTPFRLVARRGQKPSA